MHSTEHHRKLNSPEAAEYLGISVSTLSKRRVDGDGPKYLKLGRRVVYDTRDLDGWLDTRRRASTADVDPARLMDAAHADARPGRRPPSGTATPETQARARCRRGWPLRTEQCPKWGRRRLWAPAGWVSRVQGSRLVRHAKGERKIRSTRRCAVGRDDRGHAPCHCRPQ